MKIDPETEISKIIDGNVFLISVRIFLFTSGMLGAMIMK